MTTPPPTPSATVLMLPPHQFFWALLDVSSLGQTRIDQRQLGYLFESVLPLPIEQVQARYVRIGTRSDTRYLACGMKRQELQRAIDHAHGAQVLAPDALPAFIASQLGEAAARIDIGHLNLLVRDFEPALARCLKRRFVRYAALAALVAMALAVCGLERRAHQLRWQAETYVAARAEVIQSALAGVAPSSSQFNEDLQLIAELRTLRQTRAGNALQEIGAAREDVSRDLAALLAHWPADLPIMTESLVITPQNMTFRGSAPSSADIQLLADAFKAVPGWQLQQPQINTGREFVQATIQLKPAAAERMASR